MIFILDNYDSFTYNLVQCLGEIDSSLDIQVARNDKIAVGEIEKLQPERIVISPGPGTPSEAGISKEVIEQFAGKVPLLGVCLGHQCMAEVFGGTVVRTDHLVHGKTSMIHHDGEAIFRGVSQPFEATRYHSLIVPADSLPEELQVCAWAEDEGHPRETMGFRHTEFPLYGVQFHPESFLTGEGSRILSNFISRKA